MEIFRFDEEVSIPVSQFGSHFTIGSLTGHGACVRVQVMHIPPGGRISLHAATARQILAVVVGTGWVVGVERVRRNSVPAARRFGNVERSMKQAPRWA